ncbi:9965_t:CDS:2 [Funneliformis caledonium]|uniref:9965_t:CDS:1 n=1 Tax=Funneliformis caledonium TaxID=1117310 RepID=A0A9N9DUY0_9GLOM|nr:9965_t:CDS:2 [Funneliformis caledonium]
MNGMKGPSNSPLDSSPTRSLFVFTEKSGLSPVLTLYFRVCRYTTDIMVFCFVLGEVPAIENHFVVDITDKIKNISHLQNAIKEVKKPHLNNFALNDLKLWKVYIPINENEAKMNILDKQPQEVDIERDLEGQKLIPSDDVPKDFSLKNSRLGGLGGTVYSGQENGSFYEGVDLTSATTCKRESTINRLLECLFKERIILIRSPSMTGKTSLKQLLETRQANQEPHHGGNAFWNAFKRIMQTLQLFIIALASYGHYGAYATRGVHSVMDISPVNNLTMKNKWGYKDICYTKEEFEVYFNQFCEVHLKEKLAIRAYYPATDFSDEERAIVDAFTYCATRFSGTIALSNIPSKSFCGMKPPKLGERKKQDIYVICAENFESVRLIYPDREESVRLLGDEENLLGYNISDFTDDSMETD